MPIEYRHHTEEETLAFLRVVARGFGDHPSTDEKIIDGWKRALDRDRDIAAFDGSEIVGTATSFPTLTTVPGGGELLAAAVTEVTVAATHRRQGILTNMMRKLLEEARDRGEPMATLWASESIIYGRFGYGIAGQQYRAQIDSSHVEFAHGPDIPGSVSHVDAERVHEAGPGIWERTRRVRNGMPGRPAVRWDNALTSELTEKDLEKRHFFAMYENEGRPEGYVKFRTSSTGAADDFKNLDVGQLVAETDAAHAALWRFILSVDLIRTVKDRKMALDDPLWWMLADPRQLQRTPYDAIWLRLLDVPRALEARRYQAAGRVVMQVTEGFLPWAGGTFYVEGGPDGAQAGVTNEKADLVMPAATLATAYLGGTRFSELARARRVEENTAGGFALADAMFGSERAPWCPLDY